MYAAYYFGDIQQNMLTLRDSVYSAVPLVMTTMPDGFAAEARQIVYPSSVTLFIICGLALLSVIKYRFGKNLLKVLQSFFNYRQALRMFEERRESDSQATILSNVLFAWITGIFVSIALPFFGASPLWGNYTLSVLFLSAATGLLYLLKGLINNMLGVVFMTHDFSRMYIYNMFLYNRNTGMMIFPLVAVLPYVAWVIKPYVVYSVIIVYVFSFLIRQWRTFQIIHGLNVSVFYFILYLCTLEILPLLLFVKGCKVLWEFNLFV